MSKEINKVINDDRRRFLGTFLGTAAMTIGATQFGMIGCADAPSGKLPLKVSCLRSAARPRGSTRRH
jgi:hypothetical protein